MSLAAESGWDDVPSPPFPVRRFTVEEYHRLGQIGVLTEDDRVELLEGWIVPKTIHNPPHDAVVELVQAALAPLLSDPWRIRVQSAITTDDCVPEPDLAIVRGAIREHLSRHPWPDEIALVVEVADSSLDRDRMKERLYARANIPAYWIVNLVEEQVEVFRRPSGAVDTSGYTDRQILQRGEAATLIIQDDEIGQVAVNDVLP